MSLYRCAESGVATPSHNDIAWVFGLRGTRASLAFKKDVKPEGRQRLEFSLACVDDWRTANAWISTPNA